MTLESGPPGRVDEPWPVSMRAQLRRSFVLGTIGYILVVGVIVATLWALLHSVQSAKSELDAVRAQLSGARAELSSTQSKFEDLQKQYNDLLTRKDAAEQAVTQSRREIEELKKQLDQMYDFKPHVVAVSEVDEKTAYGLVGPKGFEILSQAIQDAHRHLPFNGANNPTQGFTSPGYAAFLLSKINVHTDFGQMPKRSGTPQNGDIIIYGGGYTMFYFEIDKKKFVIGMTPEGVLALETNFSLPVSVITAYRPR